MDFKDQGPHSGQGALAQLAQNKGAGPNVVAKARGRVAPMLAYLHEHGVASPQEPAPGASVADWQAWAMRVFDEVDQVKEQLRRVQRQEEARRRREQRQEEARRRREEKARLREDVLRSILAEAAPSRSGSQVSAAALVLAATFTPATSSAAPSAPESGSGPVSGSGAGTGPSGSGGGPSSQQQQQQEAGEAALAEGAGAGVGTGPSGSGGGPSSQQQQQQEAGEAALAEGAGAGVGMGPSGSDGGPSSQQQQQQEAGGAALAEGAGAGVGMGPSGSDRGPLRQQEAGGGLGPWAPMLAAPVASTLQATAVPALAGATVPTVQDPRITLPSLSEAPGCCRCLPWLRAPRARRNLLVST
ncbi:hypothetical protein HYH02_011801 [Chlamydomonas schloesseri]|uniref:Uncharacterized protein n=1 Tax=Chlamydomonas schloesseri TaxID=2026947 RepID=A0A835W4G5_9CHLO|nr:hypothetical protein HYH02_011801 [Chlamydomonas schloesseri]|eukprot:KAG2435506.1 hypothetical protein HYH02_011801 [Chlamydomonas schloesseri]